MGDVVTAKDKALEAVQKDIKQNTTSSFWGRKKQKATKEEVAQQKKASKRGYDGPARKEHPPPAKPKESPPSAKSDFRHHPHRNPLPSPQDARRSLKGNKGAGKSRRYSENSTDSNYNYPAVQGNEFANQLDEISENYGSSPERGRGTTI